MSAGREGVERPQTKPSLICQDSEPGASTRHFDFQTSHSFSTSVKGGALGIGPHPWSCGLQVEARFVRLRGPSPSSAAASRPAAARARGGGGVSPFLFFSAVPPLLSSTGMQSVQLGLWVRSGSLVIDRFLLRSFFAFGISIFIEYF